MLIKTGLVVDGLAGILGVASEDEGLRATERGVRPDLGLLVGVDLKGEDISSWL